MADKLTVLVTGIGGRIGREVIGMLQDAYDLRTLDKSPVPFAPDTIVADLSDIEALRRAMQGVDVVLHLAATSDEAPFLEQLVPNNVVGLFNTYQAAQDAGVRRIVFASTVQTIGRYPQEHGTIQITDLPRPNTMYGATKVFGEALGRYWHDDRKMEFVAIRIGWFQPYDSQDLQKGRGPRDIWLSPRDAFGIFRAAIERPGVGFALVFGTSKTEFERLSLAPAREQLGWEPQDDIAVLYPREPAQPGQGK